MKTVFIIAPTTPEERFGEIADASTGFVYYVSRTGVTGVRASLDESLQGQVKLIKSKTEKPVVVGFGISKKEQVQEVASVADGVVVGSAIVNVIPENLDDKEKLLAEMGTLVKELSSGVRP